MNNGFAVSAQSWIFAETQNNGSHMHAVHNNEKEKTRMNISKLKLGWKFLTGGPTGALDYALDCANSLADRIPDAKREDIAAYLATAKKVMDTLDALSWLCPKKWLSAYNLTLQAFADLVGALGDLKLTQDELRHVVDAFRVAYVAWRAE